MKSKMKIILVDIYFLCMFTVCFMGSTAQYSQTNFIVKRFELCNDNRGLIKFHGNITQENGNQYLSFDVTTPIPWDDNLGVTCLIQSKIAKNTFAELFTLREKSTCKAANMFMGEFWYDIERAAQFPIGVCPIPAGRYRVHHLELDFTKVTLQTFPFGTLRFTLKGVDNRNTKADIFCLFIEVENKMM